MSDFTLTAVLFMAAPPAVRAFCLLIFFLVVATVRSAQLTFSFVSLLLPLRHLRLVLPNL